MKKLVAEVERLAEADHRAALTLGARLQDSDPEPDLAVRIFRAMGNAHRALSELRAAFECYESGIELAAAHDLGEAEGLLRTSRAGAYSIAGARAEALDDLRKAERLTTGAQRARTLFQRAAVIQRFSEGADALKAYDDVIPVLSRYESEQVILAHALSNRGLIHTYHGDQVAAEEDFEAALAMYERLEMPSPAAVVVHNLGLVRTRMLDIPGALARFDEAESRLTELGRPLAGLQVDRAETLLSAGLVDDALAVTGTTVRFLREQRLLTDLAEALLVAAHASLIAGRDDAVRLASQAATAFDRQSRPGWRDRAHVLRLEALLARGQATRTDERYAKRLAERLELAGLRGPASRAALVGGSMALARGGIRAATNALDRGRYSRGSGLVEERLAFWDLTAAVRLAGGQRQQAMAAVRTGLQDLAAVQDRVAAPDARAGAAIHAERLIATGLEAAVATGKARTVLEWIDRTAVAYDHQPRGEGDEGHRLAATLDQLREVGRRLTDTAGEAPDHDLLHRRDQLESAIRRRSHRQAGTGAQSPRADFAHALRLASDRRILAFVDVGGRVVRCQRLRGDRFEHRDVGSAAGLATSVRSILTLIRRLAEAPEPALVARLSQAADRFGAGLVGDLDLVGEDLIVVPRGGLALVPWMALPQFQESDLSVAYSIAAWARSADVPDPGPGATTIVVGPRLPNAAAEAARVAQVTDRVEIVDGGDATTSNALAALQHSETVHFTCHGEFRSDNPLFSHLEMSDGPLTVYDILGVRQPAARTVVLSSCSGAELSIRPEQAFIGMSGGLLATGIRSLVASVAPVRDAAGTARHMTAFHKLRGEGLSVRQSLRRSRNETTDEVDRWLASSFLTLGAG